MKTNLILSPAEAQLADAEDYLRYELSRRSNNITRAKRAVAKAKAAVEAERKNGGSSQ